MLEPDWLDYTLDKLKISRELEEGIVRDIARRISKTGFVTETADWQAERARQAGILREDVIKRVAVATQKGEKEIWQLFKEAEYKIFDGSDTPTRGMEHIWNAALRKTCTDAKNLTKTIAITSQKTFIEAADLAHMEIMSGAFTYDTAITNAVKKAAEDGCKIRYPSGTTTSVEAAVRRAVLTGVNQTSGKICEMRCEELNCDLVEVSAHYGARPEHAEWQGGVYSRSGKHPEYESLVDVTGYGTGEGLMGYNCNHSIAPFFEGLSKRSYTEEQLRDMREHTVTYNGKTMTDYEASQLQRRMERKIRQARNKLTALDEQGKVTPSLEQKNAFAAESVRLKVREGKLRDFCKQTGRRSDTVRTRTASWNRSTSQKAVWANKKAVDNKGRSGIIKSITVDDVSIAVHGKNIDADVLSIINKHLTNGEGFYINEVVCKSVPEERMGRPLMQIEARYNYGVYDTRLILNEDLLSGRSLTDIDKMVAKQRKNIAMSFEEAVIHERGHAKLIYSHRTESIEELYRELGESGIEGISKIALDDGVEAIAEIEVKIFRGEKLTEKEELFYSKFVYGGRVKNGYSTVKKQL